jgi:hypothetical protein
VAHLQPAEGEERAWNEGATTAFVAAASFAAAALGVLAYRRLGPLAPQKIFGLKSPYGFSDNVAA